MKTEKMNCKNCDLSLSEGIRFCPQCGQTTHTNRYDTHQWLHDITHTFHLEKGIIPTIMAMAIRPGAFIQAYLKGKRIDYFKPISFVVLFAGITAFVYTWTHLEITISASNNTKEASAFLKYYSDALNYVNQKYQVYIHLLAIPLISLASWTINKKSGYNYAENYVLNAFITGQMLVINLVLFLVMYVLKQHSWFPSISSVFGLLYNAWVYFQFFEYPKPITRAWRSILTVIVAYIFEILIGVILFAAWAFWKVKTAH